MLVLSLNFSLMLVFPQFDFSSFLLIINSFLISWFSALQIVVNGQIQVTLQTLFCSSSMITWVWLSQCLCCNLMYAMCSRPRSRTSRGFTRSTITPTGRPGWTSCSPSWRSAALRSPSVRPFPRTLSICTSCTCTPRIGEGSLRYNNHHLQFTTQIWATFVCTQSVSNMLGDQN